MKLLLAALAFSCVGCICLADDAPTWVKIGNTVYGAKPDDRGPIGGGKGYTKIVTKGDYTVKNLDGLLAALAKAKPGQVVFIPGETTIDMTARIYIEKVVLKIPEGVTLAGNRGHNGSKGAQLTSDALDTPVMILATGTDVRITGLRIRGPNAKRYMAHWIRSFRGRGGGHKYYYKFPVSRGIKTEHSRLEVDNCEVSAFSAAGIYLAKGNKYQVHHNYIHHCQYNGLGYGVFGDRVQHLQLESSFHRRHRTPRVRIHCPAQRRAWRVGGSLLRYARRARP